MSSLHFLAEEAAASCSRPAGVTERVLQRKAWEGAPGPAVSEQAAGREWVEGVRTAISRRR